MKTHTNSIFYSLLGSLVFLLGSCTSSKQKELSFIDDNIEFAVAQTELLLKAVGEPNGKNYPRTTNNEGDLITTSMYDWTPGFFPGSLWYLYELTEQESWLKAAQSWTHSLEPLQTFTANHDLGFMMYCSYGNAQRLAPQPEYNEILLNSAKSLASRYNENTKTIKSWNYRLAWNDTVEWFYPVIIDNMMNLELLFYGTKISNDPLYRDIAITHANSTLANHFREDFSSYHVVNYDQETGEVLDRGTNQGYSNNSTWARGQAWAIYGYTLMYRETKDIDYLTSAVQMANWFLTNLPADGIPLWDFNAGKEGYNPELKSHAKQFAGETLKDVSAAAIACSALFELAECSDNAKYRESAIEMIHQLASPKYRANLGENGHFILKHSVGSIPHVSEIDKPLVYADYYFLESLARYRNYLTKGSIY